MISCAISCISADPSLGRIDKHSLSQQTLMELLIQGITWNKENICGDSDTPEDISEWTGVERNVSNEIVSIDWFQEGLAGSIQLEWLPLTTDFVSVSANRMSGTLDLFCLPEPLLVLSVSMNMFGGRIDLTRLPPSMTKLYLSTNYFSGKTDFSRLPKSLRYLNVSATFLEGEVYEFDGELLTGRSNVKDMRKI